MGQVEILGQENFLPEIIACRIIPEAFLLSLTMLRLA